MTTERPVATDDSIAGNTARSWWYYGWVNVIVAAVTMSATFPGRTYGLGLIKEPLRADLALSDIRFNVFNFIAIVVGATIVLPVGRLIDRLGTRSVVVLVAVALGLSVFWMSRASGEIELLFTLTLVRGLGQGALSVVAIALVGKWFRRRIGLAMGIFTVLLGIGFVIPPFAIKPIIEASGWRVAWANVGFGLFAFAVFAWLFARSTPESTGVTPDDPPQDDPDSQVGATLGKALRTPAFWIYSAAGTLLNLVFSAVTLDNESLLRERGLAGLGVEEKILAALFLCGLPANPIAGWLARRITLKTLLGIGSILLAITLLIFPNIQTVPVAVIYASLLGASGGVITVVYFSIYAYTFGRKHLGVIQSAVQVFSVFASATGPILLAGSREYLHSSSPFFYGFAVIAIILGLLCWWVRPPARPGGVR